MQSTRLQVLVDLFSVALVPVLFTLSYWLGLFAILGAGCYLLGRISF